MTDSKNQKFPSDSEAIDRALTVARECYIRNHPKSLAAFEASTRYMPGGNTRTVLYHEPFPLRIISGRDCRIVDIDGFEYVNFLGEYTAGLFGHDNPVIRESIDQALDNGISLSGHNLHEPELAELVCARFPSIDRVRFTNSGTEANLLAVSAARHVTGRDKVMVFDGGYHGGLLYFGGGGMPLNAPFQYIVAKYNDTQGTQRMLRQHADELACVLVEPVQGSAGCIPATREFLEMLRTDTRKTGAVLIFDEVMTSRLGDGGAQGLLDIIPDMTTLGKYIGGGMTFGAFGGNQEIMGIFDPRQPHGIPHAGTFNNNTLSMAAGVAAMGRVLTTEKLDQLNRRGDDLRNRLNQIARHYDACVQFIGQGSLLAMHGKKGPIMNSDDLMDADDRIKELIFLHLIERGYYIARRGFMSLMLTIGENELNGLVDSFEAVISQRADIFVKPSRAEPI